MTTVLTDNANYTAIANAIREQLGVQTTYMPSEMAAAIASIEGGGGIPSGFTYYNGVLLPTIPIVPGYDYVWIRRNNLTSSYDAIYGTDIWHTHTPDSPTLDNFRLIYDNITTNPAKMCSIPFSSVASGSWGEMQQSSGGSFGTNDREVLWSNHDMKVEGSNGEILLAGGYAVTYTNVVDPNHTYYNGYLLPTLPTVSGYDYVWIRRNEQTSTFDAVYGTSQWLAGTYGTPSLDNWNLNYNGMTAGSYKYYTCSLSNPESWVENTSTSYTGFGTDNNRDIIWTSHDILIDSANGNVLLKSGLPVPHYIS